MAATTHLIVPCALRKRGVMPPDLALHKVDGSLSVRAAEWVSRLESRHDRLVPARDLYAGNHWTSVLKLEQGIKAKLGSVTLWILSAGYGLLSGNDLVGPYSATFSLGHPDSVVRGGLAAGVQRAHWWQLLSAWGGPSDAGPRTVTDLVRRDPHSSVLLVCSAAYLDAVQQDVLEARTHLADPDALVAVSAGADIPAGFGEFMLPADHRFKTLVGGSMQELNARIALAVVSGLDGSLSASAVIPRWQHQLDLAADPERFDRIRSTDSTVLEFISAALQGEPHASANLLLRRYRDSGRACEQGRFRALYRAARDNHGGTKADAALSGHSRRTEHRVPTLPF